MVNPLVASVLGLVVASPVSLLLQTDLAGVSAVTVIISLAALAAGFICAFLLARGSARQA